MHLITWKGIYVLLTELFTAEKKSVPKWTTFISKSGILLKGGGGGVFGQQA